ncbi:hypothetical protein CWATWH0401_4115 [Crocosphaera watsonii WH 0401]|uniref:Uncharacterized protein n=1 Tax=Crocosphaera watsonii WH 0401 TaxID=555881 RepID=T2JE65_CROWT|nr:hypothetical protein CWATWH0401_4115 [Crocosphaera watsonii WH 0401]
MLKTLAPLRVSQKAKGKISKALSILPLGGYLHHAALEKK